MSLTLSDDHIVIWCSNDYLGMSPHPGVIRAMTETASRTGTVPAALAKLPAPIHLCLGSSASLRICTGDKGDDKGESGPKANRGRKDHKVLRVTREKKATRATVPPKANSVCKDNKVHKVSPALRATKVIPALRTSA
jgi:hypothetical protein